MTTATSTIETLYNPRAGQVEVVDVPEMAFIVVAGEGSPESPAFSDAIRALYSVSYGAHFLARKATGHAPRVMPLEALWWAGDDEQQALVEAASLDETSIADVGRDHWRWEAMIMQPPPIDPAIVAEAVDRARTKDLTAIDRVELRTWEEGRSAQLLHFGPYAAEGPSIRRLHESIREAGLRPRGRHHEIYLGDPRHSAPERLRTIVRQPVEPT
jgi:hypothetical protein